MVQPAFANARIHSPDRVLDAIAKRLAEKKEDASEGLLAEIIEHAQETSVYRLAAIVDSAEDAIISKDVNGVIQSWNAAAERVFGYRPEEIIGKPVLILIPEDRLHEEEVILSKIRAGERVEHFETVRRRKDGSHIEISLTISPIRDAQGRV